ncbi:hypothetical protein HYH02_000598 [Chlamydomonas schloesseri]|uniref:Protein-S-isoprenylcysteine O-methyltransferase n=1 Tax=Chlamydomonas schloesseri TaxID=2026947 RepID=A0A836BD12_9CHLO|nr:hypothetical protein HYH02_000598 [Chlamydomonas schloesseri]|eukprot:KAG2454763.1 hypothetical protein HYH02_000598 [Chlamydomonas schloesseri]
MHSVGLVSGPRGLAIRAGKGNAKPLNFLRVARPRVATVPGKPVDKKDSQDDVVDVEATTVSPAGTAAASAPSTTPPVEAGPAEPAPELEPAASGSDDERSASAAAASTSAAAGATSAGGAKPGASHPLEDLPEELEEDLIASKELVAEIMDGSAMGRRGEGWLLATLAALTMLVFPPLTLKGLVDFAATLALTSGAIFIVTALFTLGRNLSPLLQPRKKHSLVVGGIYGYVRHPMYGGLMLVAAGFTILTRNETRLAILALLWYIMERVVVTEERALSERYPEYAEYKAKVKKFLPFIY